MAIFSMNNKEEQVIIKAIRDFGFNEEEFPKYNVIRMALAWALNANKIPLNSAQWEKKRLNGEQGKKYDFNQITNKGKGKEDFDLLLRALIYIKHKDEFDRDNINIFEDEKEYLELLKKYIQRGIYELANTHEGRDIYQWCLDNLNLNINSQDFTNSQEGKYFSKLKDYFKKEGIEIEFINEEESYRHHICKIKLIDTTKIKDFENRTRYLSAALGSESVFIENIVGTPMAYSIQIPKSKEQWNLIKVNEFKEGLKELKNRNDKLGIYAGNDIDKAPFCFDLAKMPHCFVAGTSGSGKTKFLQTMIVCLLKNSNAEITVIDPKQGIDFKIFNKKITLVADMDEVDFILDDTNDEMEKRYKRMSEADVSDIENLGLGFKVIIIDELNNLIESNKRIKSKLSRLAEKARQAGIHLVLGTQKPDGTLLKGLKNNIDGKIALRVSKENESKTILDDTGAEKLLGSGDMLVKLNDMPSPKHILAPYLENNEIKDLL